MFSDLKVLANSLRNLIIFTFPFFLILILVFLLNKYLLYGSFEKYLDIIKIIIWPTTVLIILFFFKRVFTYLFFSIEEFNFFGAKGGLKNVYEVINEKVSTKFEEEKSLKERVAYEEKITKELSEKEGEINKAQTDSAGNLELARTVLNSWKVSEEENKKIIEKLETELKNIKEFNSQKKIDNVTPEILSSPILNPEGGEVK